MTERVAIATMLDNGKRAIIPTMIERWAGIDWAGAEPVIVACCYDADAELMDAARAAAKRSGIQLLPFIPSALKTGSNTAAEISSIVRGLATFDANPHTGGPANIVYLHKVAILREATRLGVLSLEPEVDWVLWLDSDIDPRAHAWVCLRQVLTETIGPFAPQVAVGVYATRMHGAPISQMMDRDPGESGQMTDGSNRYIPLKAGRIGYTQIAGFGCSLMRRTVLADLGWAEYTKYREDRTLLWELVGNPNIGILGEDVWWFRRLELATGCPPIQDGRVRCRHYQSDGSFWRYDEGPDRSLKVVFVTDEQDPAAAVAVRNTGDAPMEVPSYGLSIAPGAEALVSPEILLTLQATWPRAVQLVREVA